MSAKKHQSYVRLLTLKRIFLNPEYLLDLVIFEFRSSHSAGPRIVMSRYATAHADPQGPGDARPTAAQIVRDEDLVGGLRGKTALIVGVSAPGMGLECARALHLTGCDVFLTVRNHIKEQDVKRALSDCTGQSKFEFIQLDLDSLKAVEEGVKTFLSRSKQLNILITNAGDNLVVPAH